MKTIIVASDLSHRSRPALSRAVDLAISADARLFVIHVVNEDLPADLSYPVQVGAKTIISEQVAEDAAGRALDHEVRVVVGDPIAEIGEAVVSFKADLLIVGQHRRRKFLDQIRETTMEHLVRSSEVPVLLVTKAADQPYGHVLCGTALSGVCTAAVKTIPLVARQPHLELFHAHEVSFSKEARQDYETWKSRYPLPNDLPDPKFVEASARDALDDILSKDSYDLLAIGGHTRTIGGRYVLGKFTADLIRNPPCDLLIGK
ncbi:MAG: universal stress protein [Pseudomonadota bacterium]